MTLMHRRLARSLCLALASLAATAGAQEVAGRFAADIDAGIGRLYPAVEALYKDLHAHPELAFQETRTAAVLAARLRDLGFEVTEGVGGTGVVAMLRNGPGPTVLVRTELDALPMEEKTGLPYASTARTTYLGKETPVAHACGHDLHMAAWVGTAGTLAGLKERWQGTLMFVAQPAEETLGGARAMLKDGLYARFGKPDAAFALHAWPMAHGEVGFAAGAVTSNSDGFELTFRGRGSHGSTPDKSIDPVVMAARFVVDVQSVISREKDPFEFGVFSIGAIEGGTSGNIIPDSVTMRGTIRTYDARVRGRIADGIRRTAQATALMAGAADPELRIVPGGEAVLNSAAIAERTRRELEAALGADKVQSLRPIPPSEDFSEYVNAGVPALFFLVGVHDPAQVEASRRPGARPLPGNHSPHFAPVPEPSIRTAVKAMSLAVLSALQR